MTAVIFAAAETETLPIWSKILFIVIVLGMLSPAIYNLLKATTFQERTRKQRRKNPVLSERRYRRLWVVDDESNTDRITVYPRKKDHNP